MFHFLDALRTSEPTSESLFGKEAGVKGIVSVLMLFVTQDALSDMKQRRCSSLIYYYSFFNNLNYFLFNIFHFFYFHWFLVKFLFLVVFIYLYVSFKLFLYLNKILHLQLTEVKYYFIVVTINVTVSFILV